MNTIIEEERQIALYRGLPVTVQRLRDPWARWCIFYAGNGHYFLDFAAAMSYCKQRNFLKDEQIEALKKEVLANDRLQSSTD